ATRDRQGARRRPGRPPAGRAVARPGAGDRRHRLRRTHPDSWARRDRLARRAARPAHGRSRRPDLRHDERRDPNDPDSRRRRRHRPDRGGLPLVIHVQNIIDAIGQGSIFALIAVGISLVFGVLRLINFAYGQLIMLAGFALAFTDDWPDALSVLLAVAVAVGASLAIERVAFRPLRNAD